MESHNKWSERITMLFLTMCVGYIFFIIPINLRDDSDGFTATCTVTKAYTQERRGTDLGGMTDIGLKGSLRRRSAARSRCLNPLRAGRFPHMSRRRSLEKSTYSMCLIVHLRKIEIL